MFSLIPLCALISWKTFFWFCFMYINCLDFFFLLNCVICKWKKTNLHVCHNILTWNARVKKKINKKLYSANIVFYGLTIWHMQNIFFCVCVFIRIVTVALGAVLKTLEFQCCQQEVAPLDSIWLLWLKWLQLELILQTQLPSFILLRVRLRCLPHHVVFLPFSTAGGLSVHTNTCRCGIEEGLHFLMGGHYPFNCTQISLVNKWFS